LRAAQAKNLQVPHPANNQDLVTNDYTIPAMQAGESHSMNCLAKKCEPLSEKEQKQKKKKAPCASMLSSNHPRTTQNNKKFF
jgi:hypothetical protein